MVLQRTFHFGLLFAPLPEIPLVFDGPVSGSNDNRPVSL